MCECVGSTLACLSSATLDQHKDSSNTPGPDRQFALIVSLNSTVWRSFPVLNLLNDILIVGYTAYLLAATGEYISAQRHGIDYYLLLGSMVAILNDCCREWSGMICM